MSNILIIENKSGFQRTLLTIRWSQFSQKLRKKNIYNSHKKNHQYYNKLYSDIYINNSKRYKRLTWREREFSDVAQVLFYLLCRHFFVNLTLLRKASLRKFENGAGIEAFNRANLEFVNWKKTKKDVCCLGNYVIGLLNTLYLHITCKFWSRSITKREKVREQSLSYGFYFCFLSNILIIWKKILIQHRWL